MAKHLIATTDMSLGEVADYVGYRSYAGFWKAMKKYGQ
jgi:AraC-like DNA-binding protein